MAKCTNSRRDWTPIIDPLSALDLSSEEAAVGEKLLKEKIVSMRDTRFKIAVNYHLIEHSISQEECKVDCTALETSVLSDLAKLNSDTASVMTKLVSTNLTPSTKHRYFFLYTSGVMDEVSRLLLNVGRLSELGASIYNAEQNSMLISEESTLIHVLTNIWFVSIKILYNFRGHASKIFADEYSDCISIDQLEFWTEPTHISNVFLFDLMVVSWIHFNRARFDTLAKAMITLCPCMTKTYFEMLKLAKSDEENKNVVSQHLDLIFDSKNYPSKLPYSARNYSILPLDSPHIDYSKPELAYFIVWHIYTLVRVSKEDERVGLICEHWSILEKFFKISVKTFMPSSQSASSSKLSPHEEERLKLIFSMLNYLYDSGEEKIQIVILILAFFDENWVVFGENYYDKQNFRVQGLTIFELTTKLVNGILPIYTTDGQAVVRNNSTVMTEDEKTLASLWDKILARLRPKPTTVIKQVSAHKE